MKNRMKRLVNRIKDNLKLYGLEWEIWSGSFNRELINAILCASDEEKTCYKLIFGYWQVNNDMKNISVMDKNGLAELYEMEKDIENQLANCFKK